MALITITFGELAVGFFLLNDGGEKKLFFGHTHGKWTFPFPVRDGKIQGESGINIYPSQKIDVIPRKDWAAHGLSDKMIEEFAGK